MFQQGWCKEIPPWKVLFWLLSLDQEGALCKQVLFSDMNGSYNAVSWRGRVLRLSWLTKGGFVHSTIVEVVLFPAALDSDSKAGVFPSLAPWTLAVFTDKYLESFSDRLVRAMVATSFISPKKAKRNKRRFKNCPTHRIFCWHWFAVISTSARLMQAWWKQVLNIYGQYRVSGS